MCVRVPVKVLVTEWLLMCACVSECVCLCVVTIHFDCGRAVDSPQVCSACERRNARKRSILFREFSLPPNAFPLF